MCFGPVPGEGVAVNIYTLFLFKLRLHQITVHLHVYVLSGFSCLVSYVDNKLVDIHSFNRR